ncbi:HupE/UreJ family protein [Sulfurovum sp. CS9]|uniref:HupE/UreJ family protein n=1 Tax=Sulfurovum sp. CS9 TaxID=3391146 RepID=UPI0039EB4988
MHYIRVLLLLSLMLGFSFADEIRPGYLEIKSSGAKTFQVKWKVPMKDNMVLGIKPIMPKSCKSTPPSRHKVNNALIESWTMVCTTGLAGQTIEIQGLDSTATDVLVRITHANGSSLIQRLIPTQRSFQVAAEQSSWDVAKTYTIIGVEHILLGIDHLLFVFALLLIVVGRKRLIGTITAFTLAHSITLVAATLGWLSVPQAPVEAVIALSILFLAVEIIHSQQGKVGLAERSPWLIAFIFGLLHGFGFAGALAEVGLPEQSIPQALLFFNVGVELGQLIFVFAVLCIAWVLKKVITQNVLRKGEMGIAYVIGSLAAFWLIERTYSFWV